MLPKIYMQCRTANDTMINQTGGYWVAEHILCIIRPGDDHLPLIYEANMDKLSIVNSSNGLTVEQSLKENV